MGKLEELNTVEKLVCDILVKNSKARNSDAVLYIEVVKRLNPKAAEKPLEEVLLNLKSLGLPCIETVGRTRRKLQAEHQELWSDAQIKKYREELEKDFEDYARS